MYSQFVMHGQKNIKLKMFSTLKTGWCFGYLMTL